jgi:hypothetical protein
MVSMTPTFITENMGVIYKAFSSLSAAATGDRQQ